MVQNRPSISTSGVAPHYILYVLRCTHEVVDSASETTSALITETYHTAH